MIIDQRTDEDLVRSIQEGDIVSFEILVKRYQDRLLSFVSHIVYDHAASQDIVQESLFSLYKTINRVDTKKKFSTYVFAIAKNTAISYLRSQKKEVSLEDIVLADEDEGLYEQLIEAEKNQRVANALSTLEKKYRTVVELYYFHDLSYEEIGRRLKLPLNTVRTHLRRAKDMLRKVLYESR